MGHDFFNCIAKSFFSKFGLKIFISQVWIKKKQFTSENGEAICPGTAGLPPPLYWLYPLLIGTMVALPQAGHPSWPSDWTSSTISSGSGSSSCSIMYLFRSLLSLTRSRWCLPWSGPTWTPARTSPSSTTHSTRRWRSSLYYKFSLYKDSKDKWGRARHITFKKGNKLWKRER